MISCGKGEKDGKWRICGGDGALPEAVGDCQSEVGRGGGGARGFSRISCTSILIDVQDKDKSFIFLQKRDVAKKIVVRDKKEL